MAGIPRRASAPVQLRDLSRSRPTLADSTEFTGRAENHRAIFGFQITGYNRLIAAAAMTDVVDVQVEMITPEEWRDRERFRVRREYCARQDVPVSALSDNPVFHPDTARARIGPARRKSTPYQSAMSMLNFYINGAGKNLPKKQKPHSRKFKQKKCATFLAET